VRPRPRSPLDDTTLIAPRERDLRMVLDDDLTGWDEYLAAAGDATLNLHAVELYRRWWELADIASSSPFSAGDTSEPKTRLRPGRTSRESCRRA
jgi:hypothetical protein